MLPLIFHSQGCHLIPCCNQLSHGPCIRVLQRISLPMVEMQEISLSLGWEDPLEKEMTAHSSTLAWRIPWWAAVQGVADLDTTGGGDLF